MSSGRIVIPWRAAIANSRSNSAKSHLPGCASTESHGISSRSIVTPAPATVARLQSLCHSELSPMISELWRLGGGPSRTSAQCDAQFAGGRPPEPTGN